MSHDEHRRGRIAVWFETTRRPGLVLAGVIFLLYARSLSGGFILDDLRMVRQMELYQQGRSKSLRIYQFLVSDEDNQRARKAGWYAWWLSDGVRYRHWRPLTERLLYAQFLLFNHWAPGYRLVSLALYLLGVRWVLSLFRILSGNERRSRWAALVFAVMAGHAIPVVFISAQSDLLTLVLGTGAILSSLYFIRSDKLWPLIAAAGLFALSLGAKEVSLPLAIMPLLFWFVLRDRVGSRRRAIGVSAVFLILGLIWLGFYIAGGYGSNSTMMLDPVHDPLHYLAAMPGRAWILLSSLFIPLNPFLFYLRPRGLPWLFAYGVIGSAAWLWLGSILWRRERHNRAVGMMALWALPFVPLLACTVPDDRVMMLPSLGMAFLAGAWITSSLGTGRVGIRKTPLFLFVFIQAVFAFGAGQFMRFIAEDRQMFIQSAVDGFGRPMVSGDCAFFLNDVRDSNVLFIQMQLEKTIPVPGIRAAFLSDAEDPDVQVVDSNTLRIRARQEGLFTGFLGAMGTPRGDPKRKGDLFDAGEFTGRIIDVSHGQVREVELRFRRPLTSDSYRFYRCDQRGRPKVRKMIPADSELD